MMKVDEDKKKKIDVGRWFKWLYPSRFFEFETSLTPHECYERLQKLPGKMAYLKAKNRVELANASVVPFDLKWLPDENICEFWRTSTSRGTRGQVRFQGKVFVSNIYETTLVQGRSTTTYSSMKLSSCLPPIIFIALAVLLPALVLGMSLESVIKLVFPFWLTMGACSIFFIAAFVLMVVARGRAELNLLKNVLTEPDETRL
jgi:hypothetical protein